MVKKNQEYTLGNGKVDIPINLPLKFKNIKPGALVKIDDGYLSFKVEGTKDNILKIKSQTNGEIINGKGINLPGIDLDLDTVTKKDIEQIIANAGPTQTIRVEQAPLKIVTVADDKPYKL